MSTPDSSADRPAVRPLPANPSLEFDRKQAKALLAAQRAGDADADARFRAHHPRYPSAGGLGEVALHDAQLVIAREYGFASWPRWKQFVDTRRLDRGERAAALVAAACSNDVRKASVMLAAEPDLARHDVYTAAACGEADAVREMLARDPALATRKDPRLGRQPILYACFSRFLRSDAARTRGIVEVVRLLLAHGADPNAHYFTGPAGERWIQNCIYAAAGIANNAELTRMLFAAGAVVDDPTKDPRATDHPASEVVYHAAEWADATCLRMVLAAKPPKSSVDYCIARATDYEYPDAVRAFLDAGADPNFVLGEHLGRRTQLHEAVRSGRSVEIVRMMIDAGGDVNAVDGAGVSVLRTAVRHGFGELATLLVARGADASAVTDEDRTAAARGAAAMCAAANRNDVPALRRMLAAGAEVDAFDGGMNPLHSACFAGAFEAAETLVAAGADLTVVNGHGGTPIGCTMYGSANCFDVHGGQGMRLPEEVPPRGYARIVELLIDRGAKLPDHIWGGSDAVQDVLRRHGAPDRKE